MVESKKLFDKPTEAEIQFELGRRLLEAGYEVYFERNFDLPRLRPTFRSKKTQKIRVDIVVVQQRKILCVIEVKNYREASTTPKTKQLIKYSSLGFPFVYCWNHNDIDKVYNWVVNLSIKKELNRKPKLNGSRIFTNQKKTHRRFNTPKQMAFEF